MELSPPSSGAVRPTWTTRESLDDFTLAARRKSLQGDGMISSIEIASLYGECSLSRRFSWIVPSASSRCVHLTDDMQHIPRLYRDRAAISESFCIDWLYHGHFALLVSFLIGSIITFTTLTRFSYAHIVTRSVAVGPLLRTLPHVLMLALTLRTLV